MRLDYDAVGDNSLGVPIGEANFDFEIDGEAIAHLPNSNIGDFAFGLVFSDIEIFPLRLVVRGFTLISRDGL